MNDNDKLVLSNYEIGTPEHTVYQFLEGWKNKNWLEVLKATQKSWVVAENQPLDGLKATLSNNLKAFKGITSVDINPVVQVISVVLKLSIARGVTREITSDIRVIKEIQPLLPSPDGEWGVNPITVLMERTEEK